MLGGSLGMILGFVGGGIIAEAYNWRVAMVSVGLPGLVLAAIMAKLQHEPRDGNNPLLAAGNTLATGANHAMRHLIAGSIVAGLVGYGFNPAVYLVFRLQG